MVFCCVCIIFCFVLFFWGGGGRISCFLIYLVFFLCWEKNMKTLGASNKGEGSSGVGQQGHAAAYDQDELHGRARRPHGGTRGECVVPSFEGRPSCCCCSGCACGTLPYVC